jgi:hypothetical protein
MTPVTSFSSSNAIQIFRDLLQTQFAGFTAAYTDGSHVQDPVASTSAAVVTLAKSVVLNWKLQPKIHVIESEPFVILEALHWAENNLRDAENLVIFSDSLSALNLIENSKPLVLVHLVFLILKKLITMELSHRIKLQFVIVHMLIVQHVKHMHSSIIQLPQSTGRNW